MRNFRARLKCGNALGRYAILGATLLLQLHFNSFPGTYIVHIDVILCIIAKIGYLLYGATSSRTR